MGQIRGTEVADLNLCGTSLGAKRRAMRDIGAKRRLAPGCRDPEAHVAALFRIGEIRGDEKPEAGSAESGPNVVKQRPAIARRSPARSRVTFPHEATRGAIFGVI